MARLSMLAILAWSVVAGASTAAWRGPPSERRIGGTWCAATLGALLAVGASFALDHEVHARRGG